MPPRPHDRVYGLKLHVAARSLLLRPIGKLAVLTSMSCGTMPGRERLKPTLSRVLMIALPDGPARVDGSTRRTYVSFARRRMGMGLGMTVCAQEPLVEIPDNLIRACATSP